ncbi:MAG: hypothetical protein JNM31_01490 [Flavobacteriales bacterium]|nr:hypothetical protein [Flavobacteriales bacterium]
MKRILLGGLLLFPLLSHACDVCGIYLGIQPHDRTSSVSVLYRFRYLEGLMPGAPVLKHGDHSAATGPQYYREFLQTVEFRGEYWLGQRFSLMASVPVVNNYQSVEGVVMADIYGAGDPFVLARWIAVNTKCLTDEERTVHRIMVGGGLKMPVGASDLRWNGQLVDHDIQPGSGTMDGLLSLQYLIRHGRTGAGLASIGRFNTASTGGYQMGHGINLTAEAFHRFDIQKVQLMPALGAYMEHTLPDAYKEGEVEGTGGTTWFLHTGARAWWKAWALGINYQFALAHDIGILMVPDHSRFIVGLTYNINTY